MLLTKSFSNRPRRVALATGLSAAALLPMSAGAADLYGNEDAPVAPASSFDTGRFGGINAKLSEWNVIVGAGAMYAPKFEGSDEFKVIPIPMISATFGDRVTIDPTGLTVNVIETHGVKFSVKGGYDLGRDEDDDEHLKGLGDIDAGGVIGAQVSYEVGPATLYASVDKTIGGSEGLIGKFGGTVSHQYERFIFEAGAYATVADDNHMENYFGVTAAQSARSGLRQYEAGAGLKRVDVEASVTYLMTENWLIRGQAGVGFLTGDAKDSPIVQNDVQPQAMLVVGYKF